MSKSKESVKSIAVCNAEFMFPFPILESRLLTGLGGARGRVGEEGCGALHVLAIRCAREWGRRLENYT